MSSPDALVGKPKFERLPGDVQCGFSPTQAGARFDAMCAQASLAEALGFDVIWAHEHHSGGSTYPSPLMTLAALAAVTKRIELGTNMLLLPLHHPLRVAEDAAMVDVMSGGRLRLGVSAGYSPADLQAFAVAPDARPGGCARACR
jgi:alkanesulfonate monooxygenase SsuD/methylene tetrahydromethanopterin reductase-like flavin-dependent oxidoreductase (luciferase family)